jgi:hypothetical protein
MSHRTVSEKKRDNQIKTNPDDEFLPGSNPWEILEGKFHDAFIDYAEHK